MLWRAIASAPCMELVGPSQLSANFFNILNQTVSQQNRHPSVKPTHARRSFNFPSTGALQLDPSSKRDVSDPLHFSTGQNFLKQLSKYSEGHNTSFELHFFCIERQKSGTE